MDEQIDLREYISILRYRKWSVITVILLVLAGALAFSFQQTPLYQSQAKVLVKVPASTTVEAGGIPNLATEKEIASSEAVAALVADEPGADPAGLIADLSVSVAPLTEILTFSYSDPSPATAQRLAQAFADSYLKYRRQETLDDLLAVSDSVQQRTQELKERRRKIDREITQTDDLTEKASLQSQANALIGQIAVLQQELADLTPPDNLRVGQVVGPADLPESPASPNHLTNGLLGLMLGLALGVGLAFLRERLDDRLRGKDDLEILAQAPVLAAIPQVSGWKRKGPPILVTVSEPKSASAEAYRSLRTSVLFSMGQRDVKVVMVTSPHAGDGKTTTVANLGVVLAQAGKSVVAVSADLRRPRLHRYFGLETHTGLTNVLATEVSP